MYTYGPSTGGPGSRSPRRAAYTAGILSGRALVMKSGRTPAQVTVSDSINRYKLAGVRAHLPSTAPYLAGQRRAVGGKAFRQLSNGRLAGSYAGVAKGRGNVGSFK